MKELACDVTVQGRGRSDQFAYLRAENGEESLVHTCGCPVHEEGQPVDPEETYCSCLFENTRVGEEAWQAARSRAANM